MIKDRRALALHHPGVPNKDICGYDNRLAMNQPEFTRWASTTEGKAALSSGVLGPRTEETKSIGAHIPYPGQIIPAEPEVPDELDNICLKPRKKCRHNGWYETHIGDYRFNQDLLRKEAAKLVAEEHEIIDDAETREATKDYYAHNTVEQLF